MDKNDLMNFVKDKANLDDDKLNTINQIIEKASQSGESTEKIIALIKEKLNIDIDESQISEMIKNVTNGGNIADKFKGLFK